MKSIRCIKDLESYGFNLLTGEACKLSCRVLVDLNEQAVKTVCEYFSIMPDGLSANWNSGSIKSIMLGYNDWQGLAVFAMYLSGEFDYVVRTTNGVYGLEHGESIEGQEDYSYLVTLNLSKDKVTRAWHNEWEGKPQQIFRCPQNDAVTRNVHQFTGRLT